MLITPNRVYKFIKNRPRQLVSDSEVKARHLNSNEALIRIKENFRQRRERNEIPLLPKCPRIYILVHQHNWEFEALVKPWTKMSCDVEHFDYGIGFDSYSPAWQIEGKYEFNQLLYKRILKEHRKQSIHILFSYISGRWIFPDTIRKIKNLGIICVNYDVDDTYKFWGAKLDSGCTGSADIAPEFDICITGQSEMNVGKYVSVGANPYFLPPAANPDLFIGNESKENRRYRTTFIGQVYGKRRRILSYLQKKGINVYIRGKGTVCGPVTNKEMVDIYHNSLLVLGFGFLDHTNKVSLKVRDFEVCLSGTACLTTYNEELARYFVPDKEIIFYKTPKELAEKIAYYSIHPEEAIQIGKMARKRCLEEHTWALRWKTVLEMCR